MSKNCSTPVISNNIPYRFLIFVKVSCAAGTSVLQLLLVPSGTLATVVTSGHHMLLQLRRRYLTGLSLVQLNRARRMVRVIATTVSPSAALVLY